MNKTAQLELHRLFLIETLPEPLSPTSSHLQILDRYIERTRLRLRHVRNPSSNESTRILQQRFVTVKGSETRLDEIHLNDQEYSLFEKLGGPEIRKNRYFHEFDLVTTAFDVYLGPLRGLTLARAEFESRAEMDSYATPAFSVIEVTNESFFSGEKLVYKSFADVTAEIERLTAIPHGTQ